MGYIPHTEDDRRRMLSVIGVDSIEDLFAGIPKDLLWKGDLPVPLPLDEYAIKRDLERIGSRNAAAPGYTSFLGAGIYDHFIPSVVGAVLSRGEFLSAYTPYQAELSQGNLQSIFEFQTMICELTGMDIANASMYDGGSAAAEAALMSISGGQRDRILVSETVHPHTIECIRTYAWASGLEVITVGAPGGITDVQALHRAVTEGTACVVCQYPNFFGIVEPLQPIVDAAHSKGALAIVSADPISLSLLRPPGEFGVDIVVGEGQGLGWHTGFGGPLLGLFACKQGFARRIPGRIVGRTTDVNGRCGFVMTLRTREQDIRREKATSNICTNEALIALAATVFLTAVGKSGITQMGEGSLQNAHYAAKKLSEIPGVALRYPKHPFFKEFVVELPRRAAKIADAILERRILAGLPLDRYFPGFENSLLVAVTETKTKADIDRLVEGVAHAVTA